MKTTLTLLLLSSVALAQTTASEVKKETGEAIDTTRRYASEKKEEFEARIDARLKTLKDDVTRLKEKTQDKAGETAKDLEQKAQRAEAKLGEVRKASGNAWQKLKGGVESAVEELDKGVQSAKGR